MIFHWPKWPRVKRRSPPRRPFAETRRDNIYIMPTRYGLIMALICFLMLLGSLNYNNNLGLLFGFFTLAVALTSLIHTWLNIFGTRVSADSAEPVFLGQQVVFNIRLVNTGVVAKPGMELLDSGQAHLRSDLAPGENQLQVSQQTTRRGIQPITPIKLETRYPFGLFRAWSWLYLDANALVYPAPAESYQLPDSQTYLSSEQGDRGIGSDDFVAIRPYRHGDPLKNIHWKASAKIAGMVSKQFGGDRALKVVFRWDQLPELELESRLSLLCRLVLEADRRQWQYGLAIPGVELPPAADQKHMHLCLGALARFQGEPLAP